MNRDVCETCERMNSMTFWFPILQDIGIPVPKTIFVHLDPADRRALSDHQAPKGISRFMNELTEAIKNVGVPAFLRTEFLSDKHAWKDTCFINQTSKEYLLRHLIRLAETSELADIERGIQYHFFAIRQMIPTAPVLTYFAGDMPITTEIRYFVRNGAIECKHPYWPREVFEEVEELDYESLTTIDPTEQAELDKMANFIGHHFSGLWSIDFLRSKDGQWYCTDMALGERSFHVDHEVK